MENPLKRIRNMFAAAAALGVVTGEEAKAQEQLAPPTIESVNQQPVDFRDSTLPFEGPLTTPPPISSIEEREIPTQRPPQSTTSIQERISDAEDMLTLDVTGNTQVGVITETPVREETVLGAHTQIRW